MSAAAAAAERSLVHWLNSLELPSVLLVDSLADVAVPDGGVIVDVVQHLREACLVAVGGHAGRTVSRSILSLDDALRWLVDNLRYMDGRMDTVGVQVAAIEAGDRGAAGGVLVFVREQAERVARLAGSPVPEHGPAAPGGGSDGGMHNRRGGGGSFAPERGTRLYAADARYSPVSASGAGGGDGGMYSRVGGGGMSGRALRGSDARHVSFVDLDAAPAGPRGAIDADAAGADARRAGGAAGARRDGAAATAPAPDPGGAGAGASGASGRGAATARVLVPRQQQHQHQQQQQQQQQGAGEPLDRPPAGVPPTAGPGACARMAVCIPLMMAAQCCCRPACWRGCSCAIATRAARAPLGRLHRVARAAAKKDGLRRRWGVHGRRARRGEPATACRAAVGPGGVLREGRGRADGGCDGRPRSRRGRRAPS